MALPAQTPTGFQQILNPGFESGAVEWTTSGTANIVNEAQMTGSWCVKTTGTGETNDGYVTTSDIYPVVPGMSISLTAAGQMTAGSPGTSFAVALEWFDSSGAFISATAGAQVNRAAIGSNKGSASAGFPAPAGAAGVRAAGYMNVSASGTNTIYMDNFSWNYNFPVEATLLAPAPAYTDADSVPFRIAVSGLPTGVTVASVKYYYMTWDGSDYITPVLLATETVSPFAFNSAPFANGQYAGYAIVTLSTGLEITSNSRPFTVGDAPAPNTREYRASNSYTYLIGENFAGLGSTIPATALITGAEVVIGYDMEVLVRSKNVAVDDPLLADPMVAFDVVSAGRVEAVLLSKSGSNYSVDGAAMTGSVPINRIDFDEVEDGTTGTTHRWTTYELEDEATVTVGASNLLFGQNTISAADFVNMALGVRFVPVLNAKPAYADSGDACFRFKINTLKLRVYFDAGSVEYYFASPDKTDVIKAELAASYVASGNLATGDASGVMQLLPELTIIDGDAVGIQEDWTIHSFYPPTDANQIGTVMENMVYNALPLYREVEENRSRYMFITANFYGDPNLESMYGTSGVDRAFAYNGDYFYKIYTQPDPEKDKPRHVAFHHGHLALGYGEGRVDLSVVGEPYNFDGAQGASSWAIGDNVTGLLPLPGTVLGIFCKKSVWGLSGTTVDNFATQVISPKMGAVEYTVTDMGFPVYANAYGVYTLSQVQQYGDFMGSPLSQQVSPWLRPRLIRKAESDKEVVVAWPVRSKNQYKLSFSDGYVLTMTMNYGAQGACTFSKQKYFIADGELDGVAMLDYPAIVPAAISSELDDGGEERIHVANKLDGIVIPVIEGPSISGSAPDADQYEAYSYQYDVTDGSSPVLYINVSDGAIPDGLSLATDGTMSGTPTEYGVFNFTITVTDANGLEASVVDTISITLSAGPFVSGAAPDGMMDEAYVPYAYTVLEGTAPIASVVVHSGSLPTGMSLSSAGVLSGTPTVAGSYTFTIRATDTNTLYYDLPDTVLIESPVWNPADKTATALLQNSTRTLTNSNPPGSTNGAARSFKGVSSGKWYWEWKIDYLASSLNAELTVGFGSDNFPLGGDEIGISGVQEGSGHAAWGWRQTGAIRGGATVMGPDVGIAGPNWTTGDVLMVALDVDNNRVFFGKNGTFYRRSSSTTYASDPVAGTGPINFPGSDAYNSFTPLHAAANVRDISGDTPSVITLRVTESHFDYPVPDGYTALGEAP